MKKLRNNEASRLWEKGSLDNIYSDVNKRINGLGDEIEEIIEEAENRHRIQMLELEIEIRKELHNKDK